MAQLMYFCFTFMASSSVGPTDIQGNPWMYIGGSKPLVIAFFGGGLCLAVDLFIDDWL